MYYSIAMFRTVGKFVLDHVKFLKKNEYFYNIL